MTDPHKLRGKNYVDRYRFGELQPGESKTVSGDYAHVHSARNYYVRKHPGMRGRIKVHHAGIGKVVIVRIS